ncbi:PREDICTED: sugar transporter ERD6-like 6 isoform X1 [Papilio polytes]|uniref:sugar transporter ERD6-like 6 isoform X1 n=1 Tax=Papilio polytes TaxID=76194 RepID=UPI000675F165|nr:PREDICTED: sugar transporter ERD6-like 6 isoform X1 [Papilio polytes]
MFEYYIRQQVWISLRLYIGQILVGYGLGWTAPIIPKLSDTNTSPLPYELTETETSLIASIIYVGTILGPYVTSYLCNAVGRKPCFILAGVSSLISFLLLAIANNLAMIYVGRILCGLGSGIIFIVNLVYIGEIASTNIRGILLTSNAIFTTLGTLIVYSIGPFVSYPLVSYIAVPISGIYLLGIIFIPESPTSLMLKCILHTFYVVKK